MVRFTRDSGFEEVALLLAWLRVPIKQSSIDKEMAMFGETPPWSLSNLWKVLVSNAGAGKRKQQAPRFVSLPLFALFLI